MSSIVKKSLWVVAAISLIFIVLVSGLLIWFQSNSGQSKVASLISEIASNEEMTLDIGGFNGLLPLSTVDLTDVKLADQAGTWLTLDTLRLHWEPFELLTGKFHIVQFAIGTLAVERLPEPQDDTDIEPPPTESGSLSWPAIKIVLDEIKAKRIHLGESILGESVDASIDSRALIEPSGQALSLSLLLKRIDDISAELHAEVEFNRATENLRVDIKGDEPAGEMIAKLLNLPNASPASFTINGSGLISDWNAQIVANVENYITLDGGVDIKSASDRQYDLDIQLLLDIANLLEPKLRKLTGNNIVLKTTADVSPEWDIGIKNLQLTMPAATLALQGVIEQAGEQMDLNYQMIAGDPSVFSEFASGVLWDKISLNGTFNGSAAQPEVQAELLIESPQAEGFSAQKTQLKLDVLATQPLTEDQALLQVNLQGSLDALKGENPAIEKLAGETIQWQAKSNIDLNKQQVNLHQAEISTAIAKVTSTGLIQAWGQDIELKTLASIPDFTALADIAGRELNGQLDLTIDTKVNDFGKSIVTHFAANVDQLTLNDAVLDTLLGESIDIAGIAQINPDGKMQLSDLVINTAQVQTQAEAVILPDQNLQAQWSVAVPQLAALSKALNMPLEGALRLQGSAKGQVSDPSVTLLLIGKNLKVQEKTIKKPRIELVAHSLASAPTGKLKTDGVFDNIPAKGRLNFAINNNEILAINKLELSALGIDMRGDVDVSLAESTANGKITGKISDFAPISTLAQQSISGDVTFSLDLSEQDQQTLNFQTQAKNLEVINNGVKQKITAVELIANVSQLLKAPALNIKLQADGIENPDIQLSRLEYAMNGVLEDINWDISTTAHLVSLDQPLNIQSAGTAQVTEAHKQLMIANLTGQLGHIPFTLLKPLSLISKQDSLSAQDFLLQIQEGQIAADINMDAQGITAKATIDKLPLDLARIADPSLTLLGWIDGDVSLDGNFQAPNAVVNLRLNEVAIEQGETEDIAKLNANFNAQWANELVELTGRVFQKDGLELNITGTAPLIMTQQPTGIQVPPQLPIKANATGQLDLNIVNAFISGSGNQLNGKLDLNAKAQGTIEKLDFLAEAKILQGSFENLKLGTLINDIDLHVLANPQQVTLQHLTATTPKDGKISMQGSVKLAANDEIITDFSVIMDKAQLVAIDMMTSQVSSDITLSGPLHDAWLKGLIKINKADIYIPNKLPPSVVALEVIEENGDTSEVAQAQEADKAEANQAPPAVKISLDIEVVAENQIFVRGNGLDAEFEGDMKITGTANDPKVDGLLTMRKGILDAFRRKFEFQKGLVHLDNVPTNQPQLDFLTRVKAKEIEAIITVSGSAAQPQIILSSEPEIPQDEILARIMFDKSVGEMDSLEMLQLAASAAQLAGVGGGGPGVMDKVRSSIGLDTLKVGSAEDGSGPDIEAGRYVSEGVYVGVKQGLLPGTSSAIVQVDVTPNVKVEGNIADTSSRVGVNMEWDY